MMYIDIVFSNGVNIVYPVLKVEIKKEYTATGNICVGREMIIERPYGQIKRIFNFNEIDSLEVYFK